MMITIFDTYKIQILCRSKIVDANEISAKVVPTYFTAAILLIST